MRLEKFQRNDIVTALAAGGLDPHECALAEDDLEVRVEHVPSGSVFILGGDPGHYTGVRVVGYSTVSWPFEAFTWASVPERFERWAGDVKRDFETPDLWAELLREREILQGQSSEPGENTPFTPDERAEIATRLQEIKESVKTTYGLSDEQMSVLDTRFDELEAAAGRVGRKDWLILFYGTLFALVVVDLVPPEVVHHILSTAIHGLQHLLLLVPKRLQLPPKA